ncbi:hypothetical protein GLU01_01820, partial [Nanohaloarchaea archaeon]|nr:hypothetical protein [Candidatus Nanohaloarchaea archaeon]
MKSQNQASQAQEQKSKFNQEISSLESKLPVINSLTSDSELEEAKEKLNDTESQADSLKHQFPQFSDSEKVQNILNSINQKKRKIHKRQFNQEISSVESKLSEIDSLISDSEPKRAQKRLNVAKSQFNSLKQEFPESLTSKKSRLISQKINKRRKKIQQQEQEGKSEYKREVRSIRSSLSDIDSIISDMQLQEAKKRLEKIESR